MIKEIVHFKIGREHYGLDIENVLEIIKDVKITQIPRSNPNILGIVNIRGKINNVMDLASILGISSDEEDKFYLICSDNKLDAEGNRNEIVFPITDVANIIRITDENKIDIDNQKGFISNQVNYIVKQDNDLIAVLNYDNLID